MLVRRAAVVVNLDYGEGLFLRNFLKLKIPRSLEVRRGIFHIKQRLCGEYGIRTRDLLTASQAL